MLCSADPSLSPISTRPVSRSSVKRNFCVRSPNLVKQKSISFISTSSSTWWGQICDLIMYLVMLKCPGEPLFEYPWSFGLRALCLFIHYAWYLCTKSSMFLAKHVGTQYLWTSLDLSPVAKVLSKIWRWSFLLSSPIAKVLLKIWTLSFLLSFGCRIIWVKDRK